MFKRTTAAAVLALAMISGAAQAVNVVDTGTPDSSYGYAFNKDQYFAGEFSLLSDSVVNSIQGYFGTEIGSVAFSVYSDGGALPGSLLYTTSLTTTTARTAAWNGVSGLNWALDAGTYWVAFTPSFSSSYTDMPGVAAAPLVEYAQNHGYGWEVPGSDLGVGVRIDATSLAPVPEPTTLAMYALGLAGLAAVARRKQA